MSQMLQRADMAISAATEETKEIAEIQAKMFLAQRFPRNVENSIELIKYECGNKELAESAVYEYPRGDSVVRGASIRLVECVARHWGNIVSGVKELGTIGNRATVKAYCWDLQTNFSDEKIFEIEYVRNTKKGSYELTDSRDKYEMLANYAARRKRACMQAIIPQFVIDTAIEECQKTLEKTLPPESLEEVKNKMLEAFKTLAEWVGPEELGNICGKDFEKLSQKDVVKLRNLYNAIKDGFVKPETAFGREAIEKGNRPGEDETRSLEKLNGMFGEKNETDVR